MQAQLTPIQSAVQAFLFAQFLDRPTASFTAAEIAEGIEDATARKVGAALRADRLGFHPDWVNAFEDTRIVGSTFTATHRVVTVYCLSREGIAAQFKSNS